MTSFLQNNKNHLVKYGAIMLITALLGSCGNNKNTAAKQVKANEQATASTVEKEEKAPEIIIDKDENIRYCVTSYINEIQPGKERSDAERKAVEQIFETLLTFKTGTMNYQPALAESFTISDDKLSYVFTLRNDVIFHSNTKFTPSRKMDTDDVIFSISRLINPEHPDYVGTDNLFVQYGLADAIISVEKRNSQVFEIKLKHPVATFIHNLVNPHVLPIVSKEYFDKMTEEKQMEFRNHNPIGTGAWSYFRKIDSADVQMHYHPGYWGGNASESYLTMHTVENPMKLINQIDNDVCDITTKIPTTIGHDQETKYKRAKVLTMDGLSVSYISVNHNSQTAMHDDRVRRAMMYAINRERIARDIYRGHAVVANSLISAKIWGGHPEYMRDQYNYKENQALALQLLQEAGYPHGKGIEPMVLRVARNHPTLIEAAKYMILDLAKVGIQVNLVLENSEDIHQQLRNHNYQLILTTVEAQYKDPESQYIQVLGNTEYTNHPNWNYPSFHRNLSDSLHYYYLYNRVGIFKNMANEFAANLPVLPMFDQKLYVAVANDVLNYVAGPRATARFAKVSKTHHTNLTRGVSKHVSAKGKVQNAN